jgi:hypothetical protein
LITCCVVSWALGCGLSFVRVCVRKKEKTTIKQGRPPFPPPSIPLC